MKRFFVILLMTLLPNIFALDVVGLYEITSDVTLNEDLNVLPGGTVQCYNGSYTLTVNGNVNNMGIIQNHTLGYLLTLNCSGNLTNSGIIKNNTVNMNGTLQTILTPTPLASIEPAYFNIMTPMPLIGASDLYFRNSVINFMFGGVLDLQNGFGLNLDNCYFTGGNIIGQTGDTPVSYLYMANGSFINNSTGYNLIYSGITLIEDNVIATGNCVNNGEIKSWSNASRTFIAQDNFINNGSISDNTPYGTYFESNGYLENNGTVINSSFICYGDFTNNASFTPQYFYLSGATVQNITTAFSFPLSAVNTVCLNPSGITSQSDLYFENSLIDFNDNPITLLNPYCLYVSGGYLINTNLTGAGTKAESVSYLEASNGCYLQNTDITDLVLNGTVDISDDNCTLNGSILNYATIQNKSSYNYTLTINGDFDNEGIITSNPGGYYLYTDFRGTDLHNGGTWTNQMLILSGTAAQNISNSFSTPFSPVYVSCDNGNGVIAKSDLEFVNSLINFNGNYYIDLTEGYNLYISGGYMNNTRIIGSGTVAKAQSEFEAGNGFYMQNTSLENLIMRGTFELSNDNCSLNGSILNYATIQNRSSYDYTLTINGDFDNEGIITSNPGGYYLYTDFRGTDLHNGGTWTNQMLTFSGTAAQNISNSFSSPFSPVYVSCENGNGVIAKSDLEFVNSLINFNGNYYIDLTEGHNLYISGGYMNNTRIIGAGTTAKVQSEFEAGNGFYMQNTSLEDLITRGTFELSNDNCSLNGSILNYATIQNKSSYNYTLTINGDFDNQGILQNGTIYDLNINVNGSVKNSGTWTNTTTSFTGTADQQIVLTYGSEIASTYLYFVSEIVDAPYEWHFNNSPIEATNTDFSGIDIDVLRWLVPIDLDNSGSYYCQTNAGPTRKIFVYDGILPVPVITGGGHENGISSIFWENIPAASSYKVYSSSDPYADPSTWTFETEVYTNECSIPGQTDQKKFYFVTAVY